MKNHGVCLNNPYDKPIIVFFLFYGLFLMPVLSFGQEGQICPSSNPAKIVKWDYVRQPVGVTENKPIPTPFFLEYSGKAAFDGYGAQGDKPAAFRAWLNDVLPTVTSPLSVDVDYGKPVAVSCFVHYFHVPGTRDLRYTTPFPSAFKTVRISSKNDGDDWSEIVLLENLPDACPQKLITGSSEPAQYWRIEVLELADGAERLCSYEIETYRGDVPELAPWKDCVPDFLAEFHHRITHHKPKAKTICSLRTFQETDKGATLSFKADKQFINGMFELLVDGQPCVFRKIKDNRWQTSTPSGNILLDVKKTKMGALLNLAFKPKADSPGKYTRASVRLSADDVDLYYIPA